VPKVGYCRPSYPELPLADPPLIPPLSHSRYAVASDPGGTGGKVRRLLRCRGRAYSAGKPSEMLTYFHSVPHGLLIAWMSTLSGGLSVTVGPTRRPWNFAEERFGSRCRGDHDSSAARLAISDACYVGGVCRGAGGAVNRPRSARRENRSSWRNRRRDWLGSEPGAIFRTSCSRTISFGPFVKLQSSGVPSVCRWGSRPSLSDEFLERGMS